MGRNTEFVALGTVADIVPLWGENRALVKHGLKKMETTENIGLKALIEKSRCPVKDITSENIALYWRRGLTLLAGWSTRSWRWSF